jgi:hypothetical protein
MRRRLPNARWMLGFLKRLLLHMSEEILRPQQHALAVAMNFGPLVLTNSGQRPVEIILNRTDDDQATTERPEGLRSGHMTTRMSTRTQRVEVIAPGERRGRWSIEQKREVVAVSLSTTHRSEQNHSQAGYQLRPTLYLAPKAGAPAWR